MECLHPLDFLALDGEEQITITSLIQLSKSSNASSGRVSTVTTTSSSSSSNNTFTDLCNVKLPHTSSDRSVAISKPPHSIEDCLLEHKETVNEKDVPAFTLTNEPVNLFEYENKKQGLYEIKSDKMARMPQRRFLEFPPKVSFECYLIFSFYKIYF